MSAGYGRGYYGNDQLARPIGQSSGGGWFKIFMVVGVGAAAWYFWPRKSKQGIADQVSPPSPSSPSPSPMISPLPSLPQALPLPALPSLPSAQELDQAARSRGFASAKDYEDALIATARDLQAAGAKIELGPYLQHLAPRLSGGTTG